MLVAARSNPPEKELARWAASAGNFPAIARERARLALADIMACIIAGSGEPATRRVGEAVGPFGAGGSLAFGVMHRLPSPWAALITGTAAHALDYDDNFAPAVTHGTAVLAPALFSLADERHLGGQAVLDAYVIGLELQARIGRAVNPAHYELGWHATSTIGTIGAAGACARLIGLDAEGILAAMSIASSMAAGSKKHFGSMLKPVHAGLAAKNGVVAACLANAGLRGDECFLTGPWGFIDLYGGAPGQDDHSLEGDCDEVLALEAVGLLTKRFPCCGAAHRTLDALLILHQQGIDTANIERIDAYIPSFARANLRFDMPRNGAEAKFSLTYCGARVLLDGALRLSDFEQSRLAEAPVRELMARFTVHSRDGAVTQELCGEGMPVRTDVLLTDGTRHRLAIQHPKGSAADPLSVSELRAKFQDCADWAGRGRSAGSLLSLALNISEAGDFRLITDRFLEIWTASEPEGLAC
jgi:2-methylcitrate dehydratase PrpD